MDGNAVAPRRANGATLLFLGASVSQLPAIEHAASIGYRVAAVDGDEGAPGLAAAHVSRAIDFSDVERVADWARRIGVDGVLAISTDRGVVPAACLAAELGLPGIDVDVARRMTDKALMRRALASAGVRQPRHLVVRSAADVQRALDELERPFVLKPADSGGQRGLFMVERPGDALRRLDDALAFSASGVAIAEEFVDGLELNVLAAVRDGDVTILTVSDRLRPAGIGFGVGWIHSFPSSLGAESLEEVRAAVVRAIRALGMRNGIAFPQLIAAADGVHVVEVAARIAAGQMSDLVRYGTGIDLYRIAFAQALGEPVADEAVAPSFVRPIAIRFLTASPGVLPVGTLRSIAGMERVREAPGVLAAEMYVGPGAVIRPLQVDADRNGYVIATGDSPSDALARADDASRLLEVSTAPLAAPRRRRPARRALGLLGAVLLVGAGVATVAAIQGGARLPSPLVSAARVDGVVAPLCRCSRSAAHLQFRLARRTRVSIEVLNAGGRVAARVVRGRVAGPGVVRVAWRGRTLLGRALPAGSYFPAVVFPLLGRTVRLPGRITLVR